MLETINILKILIPTAAAFVIGFFVSTALTPYLYKYKMWKKKAGKKTFDGMETPIFNGLHAEKEVGTPKMGGVIIWMSVLITATVFWLAAIIGGGTVFEKLDFMSRNQTWIPLFTLIGGALVGLLDDYLEVTGGGGHIAGGLSLTKRIIIVSILALVGALWFYFKLDVNSIGLPLQWGSELVLGAWFILLYILVTVFFYSGGVIDGLDGLAGGIFAIMFSAYAVIAFNQHQINLAVFCAVVTGSILAFLWFNIPPARYYMSETGTMGLTVTLSVVAFLTDRIADGHGLLALPLIAFPLVATSLSDVIQVVSKKFRKGKKVFLIAPIHHHFEALGWPAYKVTMRFWVVGIIAAIMGIIVALLP